MPFSTWVVRDMFTGSILFEGSYSYCRERIKKDGLLILKIDDELGIIYIK